MINIGSVFYGKGEELGTLKAKWCHSELGVGTGIARGGPIEGYVGNYQIIYYDDDGNEIVKRELVIEKTKDYFELTWKRNGVTTAKGVAVETINGLSTGWINVKIIRIQKL